MWAGNTHGGRSHMKKGKSLDLQHMTSLSGVFSPSCSSKQSNIGGGLIIVCSTTVHLHDFPPTQGPIPVEYPFDTRPITPMQTSPTRLSTSQPSLRNSSHINICPVHFRVAPSQVPALAQFHPTTTATTFAVRSIFPFPAHVAVFSRRAFLRGPSSATLARLRR